MSVEFRALCAGWLVLACGLAQAQKLEPTQSEITFTIRQMGVPVEGRFTRFGGQFAFDPNKPEAGKVTLAIDTGSARFDAPEFDTQVSKPEWLSALKFPRATVESTSIRSIGPGRYEVAGRLGIKGATTEVRVPVSLTRSGAITLATGSFHVKRLDFRIGEGEWSDTYIVANDVQVKFRLALSGVAAL